MKANIHHRISMLLMAFALPIKPQIIPCNQYPRFIGGSTSSASTIFYHMDVASDKFAVVGKTNDATIITGGGTASSFYPYIVVQSINIKEYKWTKVFTQRQDEHFSQVAFSSNGLWLVVHGCCSSTSPIYVLESSNGNIISSNQYPNSMQDANQFHKIRTILIDNAKNVYILSQIKASASSTCQGQNLFKFNADSPLPTLWSLTNNLACKPFGLKFGRNENFIYVYGIQNNLPSVSYIQNTGIINWTVQQANCCSAQILGYFLASQTSDMMVFTSGASNRVLYNVLFSQTAPTFSMISAKQYQISKDYSNKLIMDFKIKSTSLMIQLEFDSQSKLVTFAKIELENDDSSDDEDLGTVSYQSPLPKFQNPTSFYGRFIPGSDNYLIGGDGTSINTNIVSFPMPTTTTFVMTSGISTTIVCCYKLSSPQVSASSIKRITINSGINTGVTSNFIKSLTVLSSETSSISTLNTDDFIDFPTSCPQKPIKTIMNNAQTTTSLNFNPSVKQSFNIIAPHSFSINCGPVPTLSYAGYYSSGVILPTAYFISVNPNTGSITVDLTTPPQTGTFNIQIKATSSAIPSLMTQIDFTLTANTASNSPPYFDPPLTDQKVQINKAVISLGGLQDPEGKTATIVSCLQSNGGPLPSFITKTSSEIKIEPKVMTDIGTTTVKVKVSDADSIEEYYTFDVIAYNEAPQLKETPPIDVYFDFNKEQIMTLPQVEDPEGLPYFTTIQAGPKSFLSLLSNQTLKIYPNNCQTDVGTHQVQIQVQDEEPLSIQYNFNLHIKNMPPYQYKIIPDQRIKLGLKLNLRIADYFSDPEGCAYLSVKLDSTIPPFIADNQQGEVVFSPSQIFEVRSYDLKFKVQDYQGLQKVSNQFKLTVYDAPRFVSPIIKQQFLTVNSIFSYSLPVDLSATDQYITNLIMPSYASFKYPDFTFKPQTRASIGFNLIKGSLCNPNACINFQFSIGVTNTPPEFNGIQNFLLPPHQVSATSTTSYYQLPQILDLEKSKAISVKFSPALPPFMSYIKEFNTFEISPTPIDVGYHSFFITLTDSFGSSSKKYKFNLLVKKDENQSIILARDGNYTRQNVTFKMESILRTGEAEIRLVMNQTQRVGEIISQITSQTFQFQMLNQTNNSVAYDIISRDSKKGTVFIQMKFNNSGNVSKNSDLDVIKVLVAQEIRIRKNYDVLQLQEGTQYVTSVPPQTISDLQNSIVQFFKKGRFNFTKNKIINFLLALLVQAIWSQLEDLSFLIILSIISMNIPGMAVVIQNTLLNLLYFDLLFTEEWMPDFWEYLGLNQDLVDDKPLNRYFSENGFESTLFINNIGSTLIFVLMYLFSWIILLVLKISIFIFPTVEKIYNKLKSNLIWNGSISFLNAQYSIFIMCSMINMTELKFDNKMEKLSSIMTITALIVFLSANILIFVVTRKQNLPQNCSLLQEDLKRVSFYPAFQLLRQFVTTLVLVLLREMPCLQVGMMLIISLGHQIYLSRNQVHEEKSKHYITIFNEIVGVSFYIYGLIALSNNENDNFKDSIGWFLASVIAGLVAINMGYAFTQIIIKKKDQYCQRKQSTNTVQIRAGLQQEVGHTVITQNVNDSLMVVEDYDSNNYVDKSNVKQTTLKIIHEESEGNNFSKSCRSKLKMQPIVQQQQGFSIFSRPIYSY